MVNLECSFGRPGKPVPLIRWKKGIGGDLKTFFDIVKQYAGPMLGPRVQWMLAAEHSLLYDLEPRVMADIYPGCLQSGERSCPNPPRVNVAIRTAA